VSVRITAAPVTRTYTPAVIKYLGSKRRLVPTIAALARAVGAEDALDLFAGTTRVAQALKRDGAHVTAVDSATYSHVLAEAYIAMDAEAVDIAELEEALADVGARPPEHGYVTRVFCETARYFHPENGQRIDAAREAIESYRQSPLYPVLLTSLLEAADRVDSTAGLQMAFLKQWAPRALKPLELKVPVLIGGPGRALRSDAVDVVRSGALPPTGFAYIDPPYNQHRYFTNYHVWETLVAWDAPEAYGVARKRVDARDASTRSVFNSKRTMGEALAAVVASVDCDLLVLSYNDESWLGRDELEAMCAHAGPRRGGTQAVATLGFDSARYVGARIGIFDPSGRKVGRVSHLSNRELLVIAGEADVVRHVVDTVRSGAPTPVEPAGSRVRRGALAAPAVNRLQQAT
jgi:adenine-specific DNA-methyltransferase